MATGQQIDAASVSAAGAEPGEAQAGRFLVFGIVSLALMMASVDQTIVATALPALQRDLSATVNWSSWTITIYSLGQVIMMPLAGKIGEMYGRKRVFLSAAVLFTAASLCCGFAGNIYLLVALRAVQAIGGGAFMPSATGIVSQQFGQDRDRALGLFSSIFPIGGIAGPVLGGVLVTYWSWRGIFLVNVPVGLALIILGMIFIPRVPPSSQDRLDVRGVALIGITLLAAMLGIANLGSDGQSLSSPGFLIPEAAGLLGLTAFARHVSRSPSSFISARHLVGRGFAAMNLINFLYGCAALGFGALVPVYAHERYAIAALPAGTLLTARAVGMISTAGLATFLLRRTGYRLPMLTGFALTAAGLVVISTSPVHLPAYTWLVLATGITGIGMGTSTPAANNATLQLAPDQPAAVAGLRGMFRQCGAITAVSVSSAIMARSPDPGIAQAHVFLVFAAILVAVLPLLLLVPDHHGKW